MEEIRFDHVIETYLFFSIGFGKGLGSILGGSWDGFGKVLGRVWSLLASLGRSSGALFGVLDAQEAPREVQEGPRDVQEGPRARFWRVLGTFWEGFLKGLGKVLASFLKVWRPLGFWLLCGVLTCLLLFFTAFWLFWQLFDS